MASCPLTLLVSLKTRPLTRQVVFHLFSAVLLQDIETEVMLGLELLLASQERLFTIELCILVIFEVQSFESLAFVNIEVHQMEATLNWFEINTAI